MDDDGDTLEMGIKGLWERHGWEISTIKIQWDGVWIVKAKYVGKKEGRVL